MWFRILMIVGLFYLICSQRWKDDSRHGVPFSVETGSYYQFIPDRHITWSEAAHRAEEMRYEGRVGHLATITSPEEEAFLRQRFGHLQNVWIGASDRDEEGTWRWIAGPETGMLFYRYQQMDDGKIDSAAVEGAYANWYFDEPNDLAVHDDGSRYEDGEDYAVWRWRGDDGWNDLADDDTQGWPTGFFVEFSPNQVVKTFEISKKPPETPLLSASTFQGESTCEDTR